MMTIGIDPGTATIGYGLVQELSDGSLRAQAYGVITTPAEMPMPQRLRMIFDQLTKLIMLHQPIVPPSKTSSSAETSPPALPLHKDAG